MTEDRRRIFETGPILANFKVIKSELNRSLLRGKRYPPRTVDTHSETYKTRQSDYMEAQNLDGKNGLDFSHLENAHLTARPESF